MDEGYIPEIFEEYVQLQLGRFSPRELAMYFVEGTYDKSIHPSPEDTERDRGMITQYLERKPEDFQENFMRELERMLMPLVDLSSPKFPSSATVNLRVTLEDGSEEIWEFLPASFN